MADVDPTTLTPEQATAELARLTEQFRGTPPSASPATPAEAQARLDALTRNKDWGEKYLSGNIEARREFASLTEMAAQAEYRLDNVLAGKVEPELMELTSSEHPLSTRNLSSAVESLREFGLSDDVIRQAVTGRPVSAEERRAVEQFRAMRLSNGDWAKKLLAGDHDARRELTLMSIVLSSEVA
jgi:hypothetical protein